MADHPEDRGDDPFADLPPELREMLEQLGGPEALEQAAEQLSALFAGGGAGDLLGASMPGTAPTGPVDWDLAARVALQRAAEGDRQPDSAERGRVEQAFSLAEHWLDATPLPAPPDAGRVVVASRQQWVNAALEALQPLVEPVARAATDAMVDLAREQLGDLSEGGLGDPAELGLPPQFAELFAQLASSDPGAMLRPAGASLAGLQAGQVIGELAHQLFGQYDLGIPTAERGDAHHIAVNVAAGFEGYDLDPTEIAVVLALTESAHRRLYHAVPWLSAHIASLVTRFAAGTVVDPARLEELTTQITADIDPEDPESLQRAMERASNFRLEPTEEQRRILRRLQGVLCLIGAWARREVRRAVEGRVPSIERIEEVLRRRRAVRGDGEELLARLLGLDLKPDDETVGETFVAAVEEALGSDGLHRALAHPENLPSAEELDDPQAWLARMADDADVPADAAALFGDLGEAPREASAAERTHPAGNGDVAGEDGEDRPGSGDEDDEGDGGDDPDTRPR